MPHLGEWSWMHINRILNSEGHEWPAVGANILPAIQDIPDLRGGWVLLPPGDFTVPESIAVTDKYFWLRGAGCPHWAWDRGTVLHKGFNGDLIDVNYSDPDVSGFRLSDFKIDGEKATPYTGRGIRVRNAKGWFIENVQALHCNTNALSVETCGWHRLFNFLSGACDNHIIYYTGSVDWKWVVVEANTVEAGVNAFDAVYMADSNGEIVSGHFESGVDNGRHGLIIGGTSRVTVRESLIAWCGRHGVNIYGASGPTKLSGLTILNVNGSNWAQGSGLSIDDSYDVQLTNSSIEDTRGTPLMRYCVREAGTGDRSHIVNNRLEDAVTATVLHAYTNSVFKSNSGYNPVGIIANPFDNVGHTFGLPAGGAAAPTVANQDYKCIGVDCAMDVTAGTGVSVTLEDPASGLITTYGATPCFVPRIPIGYIINFGNFTVDPTVIVSGN